MSALGQIVKGSKVMELNQRCVVDMFRYVLHPQVQWKSVVSSSTPRVASSNNGGVFNENTTCNSCIGGTREFVRSRSIPQLAGLLRCLRSGPAVFCVSLLRLQPRLCSGPAVCRVLRCLRSGPVLQ